MCRDGRGDFNRQFAKLPLQSLAAPAISHVASRILDRQAMTCVALEKTASFSTSSMGSVGNSGSITRLIQKCFCLAADLTTVHLLSSSFLGLTGSWTVATEFSKATGSQCRVAEAGGHIQKEVTVACSSTQQRLSTMHQVRGCWSWR